MKSSDTTLHQVFHIEDDSGDWRGIPQFTRGSIRQRIFEMDEQASIRNVESTGDLDNTFKYEIAWTVHGRKHQLDYWFVADADVEPVAKHINDNATFILDAMGPGPDGRMVSRLPGGLKSISTFVKDSDQQVRIFTAYPEVEKSLKTIKVAKSIKMPVTVIFKADPSVLYNFILRRIGFT